jgi:hypothetical protein
MRPESLPKQKGYRVVSRDSKHARIRVRPCPGVSLSLSVASQDFMGFLLGVAGSWASRKEAVSFLEKNV